MPKATEELLNKVRKDPIKTGATAHALGAAIVGLGKTLIENTPIIMEKFDKLNKKWTENRIDNTNDPSEQHETRINRMSFF